MTDETPIVVVDPKGGTGQFVEAVRETGGEVLHLSALTDNDGWFDPLSVATEPRS